MVTADARHPVKSLQDKLQALYALRSGPPGMGVIDLTIRKPYLDLLAALGDPHKNLPPVIHVAGTNGKGSVVAMLRSIFTAAGYRAHVYTSPHLVKFNERIVICGQEIGDAALESLLDDVVAANAGGALTFFEITTAMALLAFARAPADIVLLETGLGGRLDCTNVVERPAATIITRIGFDHMEFLGDTLPKIAAEKAGIMKAGAPCVIAPQDDPAVNAVFRERAATLPCPLFFAAESAAIPATSLHGPHQRGNAAAVLETLRHIKGFTINDTAIRRGLLQVQWPGRLQQILWPKLPSGWELWLDGAHNENAAQALAAQAALWQQSDGKPLHLGLGMMRRKDPASFVRPLAPYMASATGITIPDDPLAFTGAELVATLTLPCPVLSADKFDQAIDNIIKNNERPGRILLTGSLYLAGLVLRHGLGRPPA